MLAAAVRPWVRVESVHGRTEVEVKHSMMGGLWATLCRESASSALSIRAGRYDKSRGRWTVGPWHRAALRRSCSYVHAVVSGDHELTGAHLAICSGDVDPILAYGDQTVYRVGELSLRYVSAESARAGYEAYCVEKAANDSKAAA